MDIRDIINMNYSDDFYKQNNMDDIIKYIESLKDKFIIEVEGVDLKDCANKIKDPNYTIDLKIEKIENGIKVPYMFEGFWDAIKNHIQESVTSIRIPQELLKQFDFKKHNNIREYSYFGYIRPDTLKYLKDNTNIKNVECSFSIYDFEREDIDNVAFSNKQLVYDDIKVISDAEEKDELIIIVDDLDINKIKELLSYYDLKKYARIKINLNNYETLKDYSFSTNICLDIDEKNNAMLSMDCKDLSLVEKSYKELSKLFNIDSIKFFIENFKDKVEYTAFDYDGLDKIADKVDITVGYDGSYLEKSSYQDFRGLVESIKWYRKIISDYQLSPLEKLTYAYDIMKTFTYNESEVDLDDSRNPHRIIKTGNIVCVGYTKLLSEILYNLDDNIKASNYSLSCYDEDDETLLGYHSRGIVKIDDDKYNIHGFYAIDPTWDSYKEEGKEKLGDDYDALSLYRCFLIPFTEYKSVFNHDSNPNFFKENSKLNEEFNIENLKIEMEELKKPKKENDESIGKFKPMDFSNVSLGKEKEIFSYNLPDDFYKGRDPKEVLKDFNSRRLTFDEFLSLVRNVRMAEGYSGNILEDEMNKIKRINAKYYGKEEVENEFERK